MELFSSFCNICYKKNVTLRDVHSAGEDMLQMRNILKGIIPEIDIESSVPLFLCDACCNKLINLSGFIEISFTNLVYFKQCCLNVKSELELANYCPQDIRLALQNLIDDSEEYTKIFFKHNYTVETLHCAAAIDKYEKPNENADNNTAINIKERLNEGNGKGTFTENVGDSIANKEDIPKNDTKFIETVWIKEEVEETPMKDYEEYQEYDETSTSFDAAAALYTCQYCTNEVYTTKHQYEYHLRSFHRIVLQSGTSNTSDQLRQPHVCQHCKKDFLSQSHLSVHTQLVHIRDKPYRCTICKRKFMSAGDLNKHSLVHSDENPYICTTCNKAFSDMSEFIRHARNHPSEKPFKCNACEKSFANPSNLARHKLIHTGDKPFKCSICNKGFAQLSNMTTHKRTHTGDKPHKCTVCHKRFTDHSNLSRHKRTHPELYNTPTVDST